MSRNLRRASALAIPSFALALLPFTGITTTADAVQPAKAAPRAAAAAAAGDSLWTKSSKKPTASLNGHRRSVNPSSYQAYTLNKSAMSSLLAGAPNEMSKAARRGGAATVTVPAPTGELIEFAVVDSPIMQPKLAAKHPDIKTYAGNSITPGFEGTIRLDQGPLGFHASVISGQQSWYIDPAYIGDTSLYLSYFGQALPAREKPLVEPELDQRTIKAIKATPKKRIGEGAGNVVLRREYRLALATDPSYAAYFGGSDPNNAVSDPIVLAAKTTLMNRVNQIYNDDLAVRLLLVNGTDLLNFQTNAEFTGANGPCGGTPCYSSVNDAFGCYGDPNDATGTSPYVIDGNNAVTLGILIGASNYDIGHIAYGEAGDGGGVAYLGQVGLGLNKAGGCTGLAPPTGDFFAIDYVAHEMGHQFGGNHTFNGTSRGCSSTNRTGSASVEPGSGSSVMAYAGICAQDDLQPHTDPYFSQRSQQEISAHVNGAQTSITEIQRINLSGFDGVESFRLNFGGTLSGLITRGTNFTTTGIRTAIQVAFPGKTSNNAGAVSALTDTGFTVTYGGTGTTGLAGTNIVQPTVVVDTGTFTSVVGETVKGGANTRAGTPITTANHNPTVTPAAAKTIPLRTPFTLTGSSTDSDGDSVVYLWEQNNPGPNGASAGTSLITQPKANGPLFRVFGKYANVTSTDTLLYNSPGENLATTSPSRTFPDMAQVLAGSTNAATGTCPASTATAHLPDGPQLECFSEWLPTIAYSPTTMTFRLTARDLSGTGGGTSFADTVLTIDKTAGPFLVTSQNAATSYTGGSSQPITWAVNNTAGLAANVKISLSTDGGLTFPTVLAASTANDGSESVTIPNVSTSNARIKIEAVDNYFFAVNDAAFSIVGTLSNTVAPSISGTPTVGSELTANPGTWSPTPDSYNYQWYSNGVAIAGATASTFTPGAPQDGTLVQVRVTAVKSGFTPASANSNSVRVTAAPIQCTVPPLITGSGAVNSTVSVSDGTWNYNDLSFTYQWYADGAAIRGARSSSYVVSPTMAGRTIFARVTASRPGNDAVTCVSSNSVTP